MPEIAFVLKTFLASLVIVLCLQVKIDNRTLESYGNDWIHESSIGKYLNSVASGAAVVIHGTAKKASDYLTEVFGGKPSVTETQKAGRLQQFELKRSSAVREKEQHSSYEE